MENASTTRASKRRRRRTAGGQRGRMCIIWQRSRMFVHRSAFDSFYSRFVQSTHCTGLRTLRRSIPPYHSCNLCYTVRAINICWMTVNLPINGVAIYALWLAKGYFLRGSINLESFQAQHPSRLDQPWAKHWSPHSFRSVGFRCHGQTPRKDSLPRCNHASCTLYGLPAKHHLHTVHTKHIMLFGQVLRTFGEAQRAPTRTKGTNSTLFAIGQEKALKKQYNLSHSSLAQF